MYTFPIFNRTRFVAPLRRAVDGQKLLFVAARGDPRLNGQPNVHRMYRLVHGEGNYSTPRNFDFIEEPGTTTGVGVGVEGVLWKVHTRASCLLTVDLNMDGRDDVLLCNQREAAGIALVGIANGRHDCHGRLGQCSRVRRDGRRRRRSGRHRTATTQLRQGLCRIAHLSPL
jgi:hypothetical protein